MQTTDPLRTAFLEQQFFYERCCEVYVRFLGAADAGDYELAARLRKEHALLRRQHDIARADVQRLF